jgi:hypothetical protein
VLELGAGAGGIHHRRRGERHTGVPGWDLVAAQLAPRMIADGHITQHQYDEFTRVTHDPDVWCGGALLTTVRGRRPHPSENSQGSNGVRRHI